MGRPQPIGAALEGLTTTVSSLSFQSGGERLLALDENGHHAAWDLQPFLRVRGQLARLVCSFTGGGLSTAEWNRYIEGISDRATC